MSEVSLRVENPFCATCKFWKGSRRLVSLGSARAVRVDSERQPCSFRVGSLTTPGARCGNWQKWSRV